MLLKDEIIAKVHGGPIHRVKSTLICSGVAELRNHGLYDEYARRLPPAAAEIILSAVAATWMPVDTALAHYATCDSLELPREQVVAIGVGSGKRLHQTLFNTFALLAQQAGIGPVEVFATYPRVWNRNFDGAGLSITRTGPKDVTFELSSLAFSRYAYFRLGLCGVVQTIISKFAKTVYVREGTHTATSMTLKISWV